MAELLRFDIPKHSLVLIDEVETSLHPRTQRRLIRDLADLCRVRELQMVLTTHSPYVLEELPTEARLYIWEGVEGKSIIKGVSPEFAMTKMDEEQHPECDIYVEDTRAGAMTREILVAHTKDLIQRCLIIPYGAASVGQALGIMAKQRRFPRATCVFLDGDQASADGCHILPGGDAPERVVFEALAAVGWEGIAARVGRNHSEVVDACNRSMTFGDHHEWTRLAADELVLGGGILWQAMCATWAARCLEKSEAKRISEAVLETLVH
jgi:AAA domain, putative AbiEii toxin, Type IV TA system